MANQQNNAADAMPNGDAAKPDAAAGGRKVRIARRRPGTGAGKKGRSHRRTARAAKSPGPAMLDTDGRASGRAQRPFPARTLEEALAVPNAVREKNNGNEWDSEQVARASANVGKMTNKFF